MQLLSDIFGFIALFFLVLFIISLFKPKAALFWSRKPVSGKGARIFTGIATLVFLLLCGMVGPQSPEVLNLQTDKPSSPSTSAPPPSYLFQIVSTEHQGEDLYIKLVMPDLYPREALIEKLRLLKDEYKPTGKLACSFYYKKCTEHTNPVAGLGYLPDCSHCSVKDRDGNLIDFPYYHLEKSLADSLRALKFDSAGFAVQARFFTYGAKSIQLILSGKDDKMPRKGASALIVFQATDGYFTDSLVKKNVHGQERYYDPENPTDYYVINRADGFVELYNEKGLDLQSILEN